MHEVMRVGHWNEVDPEWDFDLDAKGLPCFHQQNIWLALAKLNVKLCHGVPRHPRYPRYENSKRVYVIEGFRHCGPILGPLELDEMWCVLTEEFGFQTRQGSKTYLRQQLEMVARETAIEATGRLIVEDGHGRLAVEEVK